MITIGEHKPPGNNPLGQNPPVSGKAGRNPVELEHNVYDVVFCYMKGGSES